MRYEVWSSGVATASFHFGYSGRLPWDVPRTTVVSYLSVGGSLLDSLKYVTIGQLFIDAFVQQGYPSQ